MSVSQTNPAINEAWGVIKVLSGDEQARAIAEAREKARMDHDSFLADARSEGLEEGLEKGRVEGRETGRAEGRAEGRETGRAEEKIEVARNLLQEKTSVELIAKATGLTLEEIRRLADSL